MQAHLWVALQLWPQPTLAPVLRQCAQYEVAPNVWRAEPRRFPLPACRRQLRQAVAGVGGWALKAAVASSHGSSFASYARVVHAQCSTRPFHRRQTSLPLGNSAGSFSARPSPLPREALGGTTFLASSAPAHTRKECWLRRTDFACTRGACASPVVLAPL